MPKIVTYFDDIKEYIAHNLKLIKYALFLL